MLKLMKELEATTKLLYKQSAYSDQLDYSGQNPSNRFRRPQVLSEREYHSDRSPMTGDFAGLLPPETRSFATEYQEPLRVITRDRTGMPIRVWDPIKNKNFNFNAGMEPGAPAQLVPWTLDGRGAPADDAEEGGFVGARRRDVRANGGDSSWISDRVLKNRYLLNSNLVGIPAGVTMDSKGGVYNPFFEQIGSVDRNGRYTSNIGPTRQPWRVTKRDAGGQPVQVWLPPGDPMLAGIGNPKDGAMFTLDNGHWYRGDQPSWFRRTSDYAIGNKLNARILSGKGLLDSNIENIPNGVQMDDKGNVYDAQFNLIGTVGASGGYTPSKTVGKPVIPWRVISRKNGKPTQIYVPANDPMSMGDSRGAMYTRDMMGNWHLGDTTWGVRKQNPINVGRKIDNRLNTGIGLLDANIPNIPDGVQMDHGNKVYDADLNQIGSVNNEGVYVPLNTAGNKKIIKTNSYHNSIKDEWDLTVSVLQKQAADTPIFMKKMPWDTESNADQPVKLQDNPSYGPPTPYKGKSLESYRYRNYKYQQPDSNGLPYFATPKYFQDRDAVSAESAARSKEQAERAKVNVIPWERHYEPIVENKMPKPRPFLPNWKTWNGLSDQEKAVYKPQPVSPRTSFEYNLPYGAQIITGSDNKQYLLDPSSEVSPTEPYTESVGKPKNLRESHIEALATNRAGQTEYYARPWALPSFPLGVLLMKDSSGKYFAKVDNKYVPLSNQDMAALNYHKSQDNIVPWGANSQKYLGSLPPAGFEIDDNGVVTVDGERWGTKDPDGYYYYQDEVVKESPTLEDLADPSEQFFKGKPVLGLPDGSLVDDETGYVFDSDNNVIGMASYGTGKDYLDHWEFVPTESSTTSTTSPAAGVPTTTATAASTARSMTTPTSPAAGVPVYFDPFRDPKIPRYEEYPTTEPYATPAIPEIITLTDDPEPGETPPTAVETTKETPVKKPPLIEALKDGSLFSDPDFLNGLKMGLPIMGALSLAGYFIGGMKPGTLLPLLMGGLGTGALIGGIGGYNGWFDGKEREGAVTDDVVDTTTPTVEGTGEEAVDEAVGTGTDTGAGVGGSTSVTPEDASATSKPSTVYQAVASKVPFADLTLRRGSTGPQFLGWKDNGRVVEYWVTDPTVPEGGYIIKGDYGTFDNLFLKRDRSDPNNYTWTRSIDGASIDPTTVINPSAYADDKPGVMLSDPYNPYAKSENNRLLNNYNRFLFGHDWDWTGWKNWWNNLELF